MTVDYEMCVKAYSQEQAEEFVSEKFRAECPDEMFAIDSTFEEVYADEDDGVPGDEDFDATDEPLPVLPQKKGSKKKIKKRGSS